MQQQRHTGYRKLGQFGLLLHSIYVFLDNKECVLKDLGETSGMIDDVMDEIEQVSFKLSLLS